MLAIAAPALGIRLAYPAIDAPADLPVVSTIETIQAAFPQSPAPAEVVVTGQHLDGPAVTSAISTLQSLAAKGGPIREPVTTTPVADGRALIVSVPLAGNGGDSASYAALDALRDQILPQTFGGTGVSYAVAGDTASNHDNAGQLSARTPLVLAVVAAVAFCVLLFSFRSLVLPLVSIALNFLSVAAAYGLITVIFQDGRLQGLLGYTSSGAITPWVPLFLFTFLFGISMDYHVFILSRIRELRRYGSRRDHGRRRHGRHRQQRRGRLQRGAHHGRRLLHLHRHGPGRAEDARRRPGGRHPAGRHDRPRRPPARRDDPARRPLLVPAPLAVLAPRRAPAPHRRKRAPAAAPRHGAGAGRPRWTAPAAAAAGTGRPGAPPPPGGASPWSGSPWPASRCG